MHRLLEFFYQYRAFLFFVLLEAFSIWLIVENNNYQSAAFFNSSNRYAGNVLEVKSNIRGYFELKQVNQELADENARLRQNIVALQQAKDLSIQNKSDFLRTNQYQFVPAKVINNSTAQYQNFMTINKGREDGLKKGMGVISSNGVAGVIKDCSDHFCTAWSVLNTKVGLIARIKGKNTQGDVIWNGTSVYEISLQNVPRNEKIAIGDTVITSADNAFFPEGVMIGKIKEAKLGGGSFWNITLELSTNFNALSYVYVIENKMAPELDSLKKVSIPSENEKR